MKTYYAIAELQPGPTAATTSYQIPLDLLDVENVFNSESEVHAYLTSKKWSGTFCVVKFISIVDFRREPTTVSPLS